MEITVGKERGFDLMGKSKGFRVAAIFLFLDLSWVHMGLPIVTSSCHIFVQYVFIVYVLFYNKNIKLSRREMHVQFFFLMGNISI